jgi:hypothetical protein
LSSSWVDCIKNVGNALYTESTSKLGYIEGTSEGVYIEGVYSRIYARSRNKVVYMEFASCYRLVLLIAENKLVYTPLKISMG